MSRATVSKKTPGKTPPPTGGPTALKRVEEIDFYHYLTEKTHKRYIEEINIADHLKKEPERKTP
jgi:hypothetical protein